jgi:hypothetical protein
VKDHGFGSWLHLDEVASAVSGAGSEGAAQGRASEEARAAAAARPDAASGRLGHEWLEGQPALDLVVTLDNATGRSTRRFWSKRKARPRPLGAQRSIRRTRAADEPRPIAGRTTPLRLRLGRSTAGSRPRSGGRWRNWASSISAPIRLGRRVAALKSTHEAKRAA